jgi:NADH:ubiquinone oxidoreductase subunit 6 (subunit J)
LRVIIIVVQVGAVKIYVTAAVETLRKKERHNETQFTTKIGGKASLCPSYFVFVKFSFQLDA